MSTFILTEQELAPFRNLPEAGLIELAAELDLLIPERISREVLLIQSIERIAELAQQEGLPLSRYDREDLAALPQQHLAALAELCGVKPTVGALLKAGRQVYKLYEKRRPQSPVAMMLPMLLAPLARYALQNRN